MNTIHRDAAGRFRTPSIASRAPLRRGGVVLAGAVALTAFLGGLTPAAPAESPLAAEVVLGSGAGVLEVRTAAAGSLSAALFDAEGEPAGALALEVRPLGPTCEAGLHGTFAAYDSRNGDATNYRVRGLLEVHPSGLAFFYGLLIDPQTGVQAGLLFGNATLTREPGGRSIGRHVLEWERWIPSGA